MGASSRSPSPITMRPEISISPSASRIASTAAPSAVSRSPRPIQREAARAARSVTLIKSRELTMKRPLQGKHRNSLELESLVVSARIQNNLAAAGPAPFVAVALAGFTLGFFAWLGLIVPRHDSFLSNIG